MIIRSGIGYIATAARGTIAYTVKRMPGSTPTQPIVSPMRGSSELRLARPTTPIGDVLC